MASSFRALGIQPSPLDFHSATGARAIPKSSSKRIALPGELPASQIFDERVIDELPLGVVVLDRQGYVVKYNAFEERLARRDRNDVIGRSFFRDVAVCTDVPEVRGRFERGIADNELWEDIEYAFDLPFLPHPRDVRILLRSFELGGGTFAILLIEDITEKKELQREQDRLLSVLMHDLKNPLQGILGYADLLRKGVFGELAEAKQRDALDTIRESSRKMNRLLEVTLGDLRGEARRRREVNLHALVLSSIGNLLPLARERDVEIFYRGRSFERTEFPQRAIVAVGVVEQLASVVQNLLSNAVKYARGEIRVRLSQEDDGARLEVEDDGPGISEADREKIFEEGFQAPGSRPGHGLGLFSVRRTVKEHGGELTVDSQPGEGSIFRVVLPGPG